MPDRQPIDEFLDSLVQRRYSPLTVKHYRRDLDAFYTWCQDLPTHVPAGSSSVKGVENWRQVNEHHVRVFIAGQHRAGLSGRSLQRLLSSLRSFFLFMLNRGLLRNNPAAAVKAPKSGRKLPDLLDVDQIQDGFTVCRIRLVKVVSVLVGLAAGDGKGISTVLDRIVF